ncbi:adenine nucleotide alpha hydrolases-like protein [Basidiobolus meristosporus CBS 931.73]|uniref:Diphthine--ammonia ligase n=1 Tax=Basidiobolus meristosporus CBS 931.73 TaxID=1314790 RepID=A0A1Y1ZCV1_9FUNG|nr:adenine nucleotide alpha hydrolases-like protein [Basidiobolus meristosporus CBS 931.73]|eukprot:ORY08019.1 adenine nucleotide alpha hydrolases-like protein [Basidiobolus meristosporus CBS 931.73]
MSTQPIVRAVVAFTGGKDSVYALQQAKEAGFEIATLVTFTPSLEKEFLAHNKELIKAQASALGLPHRYCIIKEPYLESYQENVLQLKEELKISALVTGDIIDVTKTCFMERVVENSGVELWRPLWDIERAALIQSLISHGYDILLTCANKRQCGPDGAELLVGKQLNLKTVSDIFPKLQNEIDVGGELGEYHTMVLDAPGFLEKILVDGSPKTSDDENYLYFDLKQIQLISKT